MSIEEKILRTTRKHWDWCLVALFVHAGLVACFLGRPVREPIALFVAAVFWLVFGIARRETK